MARRQLQARWHGDPVALAAAYYGWLVKDELIDRNPFKGITVSVPAEAKLTPSEDEIDAMLARAKSRRRDHALLMLLVDSGARKGEIAALTVKDVDLASGMVTFRVSKTVARTVPLTDRYIVAVGKWLRERGDGGSLWSVADPYSLVRAVLDRYSDFTRTHYAEPPPFVSYGPGCPSR